MLAGEGDRLRRDVSVVVVSADFAESTAAVMADLRRHLALTALWAATPWGQPPSLEDADHVLEARFVEDWKQRDVVELAG